MVKLKLAPHRENKITAMTVAAMLVGKDEFYGMTTPRKNFYILAYLNLVAVFGVIFMLSLWCWWLLFDFSPLKIGLRR